jgi:hypothetical protein
MEPSNPQGRAIGRANLRIAVSLAVIFHYEKVT